MQACALVGERKKKIIDDLKSRRLKMVGFRRSEIQMVVYCTMDHQLSEVLKVKDGWMQKIGNSDGGL